MTTTHYSPTFSLRCGRSTSCPSMSQTRPHFSHHESSERGESLLQDEDELGLLPLLAEVTVFVVPGKLDLAKVYGQIDALGGERVLDPNNASLIVTGLRGAPRLERVLGPGLVSACSRRDTRKPAQRRSSELTLQRKRAIVTAQYVADVYSLAFEASDGAVPALPNRDRYLLRFRSPSVEIIEPAASPLGHPPPADGDGRPSKRARLSSSCAPSSTGVNDAERAESRPRGERTEDEKDETRLIGPRVGGLPDVEPYPADIDLSTIPRMAVLRPSPLECVNQDIIDAIKPIYLEREFDESTQINTNVLSYRRSMAILKSVPRRIRSGREALALVDVGEKVANRVSYSSGRSVA